MTMKFKDIIIRPLSLGIGLAIGVILIAKVCFEMSYDSFYEDIDRVYCINTGYSQQGADAVEYGQVSGAIAPAFKQFVPGVEVATRTTFLFGSRKFYTEDKRAVDGFMAIVDTCFFDVFSRETLAGNPKEILAKPMSVMVSQSFAEKIGGVQEALGQSVYNEDAPSLTFTVEGVYEDFPDNGSLDYDILLSMASYPSESTENWLGNDRYKGYVKLYDGVDPSSLKDAIRKMQEENQPLEEIEKQGNSLWYYLEPFDKLHTSDPQVRNLILILSIVACLMLLISVMNYVLIALSAIVRRSKEVGVRKCFGAEPWNICSVLMKEAAVHLAIAVVIAALLILAFRGVAENLLGVPLASLFMPQSIIASLAICLVVFLVSSLVPAWLYSRIPVSSALRNYTESRRKWKLALLLVQFTVNVFLLVLMSVIAAQYDKAVHDNPGYDYADLLYFDVRGAEPGHATLAVSMLSELPEVEGVERTYCLPIGDRSGNNIYLPDSGKELFNVSDQYEATEGFFHLMGIPFVEGTWPKAPNEIAVSESFVEKMKEFQPWEDGAVGKTVFITEHCEGNGDDDAFIVCGVYKDYRIGTLNDADTRPSVKFYGKDGDNASYMPKVIVKVNGLNSDILKKVQDVVREAVPEKDIEVKAYRDTMRSMYDGYRKTKNTILAGCLFSVLVALFGLIGYVRDESNRRSKEMAVRKINGATAGDIISIFVVDILKLVAVAAVLGDVAAWFAADSWLQQFAEKVSLNPLHFIVGDAVVAAVIVGAVIINCLGISAANPVESLKNE